MSRQAALQLADHQRVPLGQREVVGTRGDLVVAARRGVGGDEAGGGLAVDLVRRRLVLDPGEQVGHPGRRTGQAVGVVERRRRFCGGIVQLGGRGRLGLDVVAVARLRVGSLVGEGRDDHVDGARVAPGDRVGGTGLVVVVEATLFDQLDVVVDRRPRARRLRPPATRHRGPRLLPPLR